MGVERDAYQGIEWLKKAVKYKNSFAGDFLGELYYTGKYIEGESKNYDKAFECLKMAAEHKSHPIANSMRLLAACYRYGFGTTKDSAKEQYWMEEAANHDDEKAKSALGLLERTF